MADKAVLPAAAMAFGSRVRPSPFFQATLRWGASVFTTYNHTFMPAVYESAERDYHYLCSAATLWDVAGERQVEISGRDAAAFAQYLTPRNLSSCAVDRCRYILLTGENGGVLNDPILLRLAEDKFWLSLADSDILLWCRALAAGGRFDVRLTMPDVSPLQLQGPRAADIAADAFGEWTRALGYFHMRRFDWQGAPLVISRTGWSGERGYEIYLCDGEYGDRLWERLMAAGAPYGIRPAAPSMISRVEAGMLSYGADINADDTPFHINLQRLTHLDDDFDFIGKSALLDVRRRGVSRRLAGVRIEGEAMRAPLVRWWNVFDAGGARIGKVRSAVYSPALKENIGIAMLDKPHDAAGARVVAHTEYGEERGAVVCELPFIAPKR